jgi:RNA polymerase sigma-70 factor (ECF subfamily)
MTANTTETDALLQRVSQGDKQAWGELVGRQRDWLRRMVGLRLDRQLQSRIDPSDVIQESCLEAWTRLPEYLHNPAVPFFVWLRFLTGQQLLILHRHHLGRQMRDAGREVSLHQGSLPEASSAALAAQLLGQDTRPSEAAMRIELKIRIEEALNGMDPIDREVLVLRHFEQLSRAETAAVLGMRESAVSKRYVRALQKLKDILSSMPGGLGAIWT